MAEIICGKCGTVCKTLQSWKGHNSRTHGGYTPEELAEAAGVSVPGPSDDARSRMARMADAIPASAEELPEVKRDAPAAPAAPPPPPPEKRVKFSPKHFHKILSAIPAKILEAQKIPLDDEDKDALEEISDFMTDVFGFEFAVPESKYVVKNRLFVIPVVVIMCLLIVVKHKAPMLWKLIMSSGGESKDVKEKVGSVAGSSNK